MTHTTDKAPPTALPPGRPIRYHRWLIACVAILMFILLLLGLTYVAGLWGANSLQVNQRFHYAKIKETPLAFNAGKVLPAVVIQVAEPNRVLFSVIHNSWVKEVMKTPLGKGFVGPWAGILETQGESVGAYFKGRLSQLLIDQLFAEPRISLVYFNGGKISGQPALVFMNPSLKVLNAVDLIAQSSVQKVSQLRDCQGGELDEKELGSQAVTLKLAELKIAQVNLYAGISRDRVVLSSQRLSALQALCTEGQAYSKVGSHDIEVKLNPAAFGPESLRLAQLLGFKQAVHVSFTLNGEQLVPAGIGGELTKPAYLTNTTTPPPLGLIPASSAVSLMLSFNLPQVLNEANLQSYFEHKSVPLKARQVWLLWEPTQVNEKSNGLAMIWSEPQDRAALEAIFSNGSGFQGEMICEQLVLSGGESLSHMLSQSCAGKIPTLKHLSPTLGEFLQKPAALRLSVQWGKLLSSLMMGAYTASLESDTTPQAPIMQQSAALLEQLPLFNWSGVVEGAKVKPEGMRTE